MKNIMFCFVLLSCSTSCATTFTDRSKVDAAMTHRIEGDRLFMSATITNNSDKTITFVHHPDFWSISVFAKDRKKDELVGSFPLVSYVRSTEEDLESVPPGGEVSFSEEFIIRKKPGGIIEVQKEPQFFDNPHFMRIRDDELWAQFYYGKYPDYLPERAWMLGKNYVMVNIGAHEFFSLP